MLTGFPFDLSGRVKPLEGILTETLTNAAPLRQHAWTAAVINHPGNAADIALAWNFEPIYRHRRSPPPPMVQGGIQTTPTYRESSPDGSRSGKTFTVDAGGVSPRRQELYSRHRNSGGNGSETV